MKESKFREPKFRYGDSVLDNTNNHIYRIEGVSLSTINDPAEYYLTGDDHSGGYWAREDDLSPAIHSENNPSQTRKFSNGEEGLSKAPAKSIPSDGSDTGSALTSKHYNSKLIQPIEIAQMVLTKEEFVGAMKFNIMKYTQRAGSKEGESSTKDWNKALQYKLWLELAEEGSIIDPRKDVV